MHFSDLRLDLVRGKRSSSFKIALGSLPWTASQAEAVKRALGGCRLSPQLCGDESRAEQRGSREQQQRGCASPLDSAVTTCLRRFKEEGVTLAHGFREFSQVLDLMHLVRTLWG